MSASPTTKTHRYDLGPMVLESTPAWPEHWAPWLDAHQHPVPDGDPRPLLHVERFTYTPGKQTSPMIDDLDVRRDADDPDVWIVSAERALHARCNIKTLSVDLEIHGHFELPLLTLINTLRGMFTAFLPSRFDGLMFHASSAVKNPGTDNAQGVLFSGVSGQGKTTLSLALTAAKYISDDISVVTGLSTETPRVLASPFFGSAGKLGHNVTGPFSALALLDQSTDGKTHVTRIGPGEALKEVMRHIICFSADALLQQTIMDRAFDMVQRVPVIKLVRALETPADEVLDAVLLAAR